MTTLSPGWGRGKPAGGVYWTRERITEALQRYAAENKDLPRGHHEWSEIKRGRLELPTAGAILEIWGSMAAAWLAVGVPRKRFPMTNSRWSQEELDFLQEHAGTMRLEDIARRLNRSYAAVRTRLGVKGFGLKARENAGYMSANAVAREYGVDVRYVHACVKTGLLPAERFPYGRRLMIDPADAERVFGRDER